VREVGEQHVGTASLCVNSVLQAVSLLLVVLMRLGQHHGCVKLVSSFSCFQKRNKPAVCLLPPCLLLSVQAVIYPVCVCSFRRRNVSTTASVFSSPLRIGPLVN
jgi:hypothetical protein